MVGLFVVLYGFFFFNDTATTEIYTLSLHDALPISIASTSFAPQVRTGQSSADRIEGSSSRFPARSEEQTSELQSRLHLVCRLLLEKKNATNPFYTLGSVTTTSLSSRPLPHGRPTQL